MSFIGKILSAAADQLWSGPFGPLLTALVGEQRRARALATDEEDPSLSVAFTIGVIALAAKMAKADGTVTADEIRAFRDVFRFEAEDEVDVGRAFDRARQSTEGYEIYAKQLADMFKDRQHVLEELLSCLFHIAHADNEIHPGELEFLATVAEIFGFSPQEFERLQMVELSGSDCDPYLILGLSCNAPFADVKTAYRELVREVHPDRLVSQGLPEERIAAAEQRLVVINSAYEQIEALERRKAGNPDPAEQPQ